jgi:ABC-type transport system involved in cytochrome c biogenesis permease subunit
MTGPLLLYLTAAALALALVAALFRSRRLTLLLSLLGLALQLTFIVLRSRVIGFLPFASRFEAMGLFALAIQTTGLALFMAARQLRVKVGTDLLSLLFLGGALVPVGYHSGGDLNPILNSPWFAFHILVSFAGYGCFAAGLVWSVVHLFDRRLDQNPSVPGRLALAGLLLLGTGIVTGSAWADASWGTYWSWDPKESWALLTWTLAFVYLHFGDLRPCRRVSFLFYALIFLSMMFTFVGINLLRFGLHRY